MSELEMTVMFAVIGLGLVVLGAWLYAIRVLGCGDVSAQFWKSGTDPHTTDLQGDAVGPDESTAVCMAAIKALGGQE